MVPPGVSASDVGVEEIEEWNPGDFRDIADNFRQIAQHHLDTGKSLTTFPFHHYWSGEQAKQSFLTAVAHANQMKDVAGQAVLIAKICDAAAKKVEEVKKELDALLDEMSDYGLDINRHNNTVYIRYTSTRADQVNEAMIASYDQRVKTLIEHARMVDDEAAVILIAAIGKINPSDTQKIVNYLELPAELASKAFHTLAAGAKRIYHDHEDDINNAIMNSTVDGMTSMTKAAWEDSMRPDVLKKMGEDPEHYNNLNLAEKAKFRKTPAYKNALREVLHETRGASKIFHLLGPAGDALLTFASVAQDIHQGMNRTEAITTETAGTATGIAAGIAAENLTGFATGVLADMAIGTEIGSVIPGAGTVVGAAAGLIAGVVIGIKAPKIFQSLWH